MIVTFSCGMIYQDQKHDLEIPLGAQILHLGSMVYPFTLACYVLNRARLWIGDYFNDNFSEYSRKYRNYRKNLQKTKVFRLFSQEMDAKDLGEKLQRCFTMVKMGKRENRNPKITYEIRKIN